MKNLISIVVLITVTLILPGCSRSYSNDKSEEDLMKNERAAYRQNQQWPYDNKRQELKQQVGRIIENEQKASGNPNLYRNNFPLVPSN
jgi:outer membrane biogenesis lipoprotein LolB